MRVSKNITTVNNIAMTGTVNCALLSALLAMSSCANIDHDDTEHGNDLTATSVSSLLPTKPASQIRQNLLNWSKVEKSANQYYRKYYQVHPEVAEVSTEDSLKGDLMVESFAKDSNISLIEAQRRLRIQGQIAGLYSALENELGEALVSAAYTGDTSEYRLELNTLKSVAPGRYLYRFLVGPAKGSSIIVVIRSNSNVTMAEIIKILEDGNQKLKSRYPNAHVTSGYNALQHKLVVTFYGTELTESQRLSRETELTELFGFPVMVEAYLSYLVDL